MHRFRIVSSASSPLPVPQPLQHKELELCAVPRRSSSTTGFVLSRVTGPERLYVWPVLVSQSTEHAPYNTPQEQLRRAVKDGGDLSALLARPDKEQFIDSTDKVRRGLRLLPESSRTFQQFQSFHPTYTCSA